MVREVLFLSNWRVTIKISPTDEKKYYNSITITDLVTLRGQNVKRTIIITSLQTDKMGH